MRFFEGYVERVHRRDNSVFVRVVAGGFDPSPEEAPVLLVEVKDPVDGEGLYETLLHLLEVDDGCYLAVQSEVEAILTSDHGNEIPLRGSQVVVTEAQYDASDFERLAKQNHEWGMSQYKAATSQSERLHAVRQLLAEQHARLSVKIQGHESGSTAHTLYEQHLSFLSRALAEFAVA